MKNPGYIKTGRRMQVSKSRVAVEDGITAIMIISNLLRWNSNHVMAQVHCAIFVAAPFNKTSSPGRFDKIILRAGHNKSWGADWDRENSVYTLDQFGRDLQLLMSRWGSHGTFVHLYINGKYWGLYNPSERMDDNAMSIHFGREDDDYYFGKGKGGDQAGNEDRYDTSEGH